MKFIVDGCSLYSLEELKLDLINEIKRDTLENNDDKNIVKRNMELLEKVIKENNYTIIVKELEPFGYDIVKVKDIISYLYILRSFYNTSCLVSNTTEQVNKCIDELIENIERDLK